MSNNVIDFQSEKRRREVASMVAECLDVNDVILDVSSLVYDVNDMIETTEDAIIISMGEEEES